MRPRVDRMHAYGLTRLHSTTPMAADGAICSGARCVLHAVSPNLAWAPTKHDPDAPPSQGIAAPVPIMRRTVDVKTIVMPAKGADVFIAPNANVMGDVRLGAKSSVWYGAVLRGEWASMRVQDTMLLRMAAPYTLHSLACMPRRRCQQHLCG